MPLCLRPESSLSKCVSILPYFTAKQRENKMHLWNANFLVDICDLTCSKLVTVRASCRGELFAQLQLGLTCCGQGSVGAGRRLLLSASLVCPPVFLAAIQTGLLCGQLRRSAWLTWALASQRGVAGLLLYGLRVTSGEWYLTVLAGNLTQLEPCRLS